MLCCFSRNNFSKEGITAGKVAHISRLHDLRLADSSQYDRRGKPVKLAEERGCPRKEVPEDTPFRKQRFPYWPHAGLTATFLPFG